MSPEEKLEEIWALDQLGRRRDADMICRFLVKKLDQRKLAGYPRSYVLNIDSSWGSGKTFFLTRFKQHLEAQGFVSVYVNAWEDDHSDDPFISVLTAIQEELGGALKKSGVVAQVAERTRPLGKTAGRILGTAVLGGAKHLAKRAIGDEAVEALGDGIGLMKDKLGAGETEEGEQPSSGYTAEATVEKAFRTSVDSVVDQVGAAMLEGFNQRREAHQNFKMQLSELAEEVFGETDKQPPIFVLIDELDRCRPDYAVTLLEQVKHLFSVENFVFVLGTDTEQLCHAISGVYGQGFDGRTYLKRFVDRAYSFPNQSKEDFIASCFSSLGLNEDQFVVPPKLSVIDLMQRMFAPNSIELRDVEQMMDMLATFVAVWAYDGLPINLLVLLPLIHEQHVGITPEGNYKSPMRGVQIQQSLFGPKRDGTPVSVGQVIQAYLSYATNINVSTHDGRGNLDRWVQEICNDERQYLYSRGHNLRGMIAGSAHQYKKLLGELDRWSINAESGEFKLSEQPTN